ncbi:MAG: CYTH domain-containing protein, partial [Saprospiraceae bacterium]|nr:CYTH domain-containing protein [Saprospiraceae bacterium]
DAPALKNLLLRALGEKVTVRKRREIYFMDNVKIHLDELEGLGRFVEIEAIGLRPELGAEQLRAQCDHYIDIFGIKPQDMLAESYSDLI